MKHISDLERLTQMTLNRKYAEIEEKDKQLQQLNREIEILKMKIREDKDTINQLCRQISYLSLQLRGAN